MARTYRDQKAYLYWHHNKVCERHGYWPLTSNCVCSTWWDYSMKYFPEPSWWNKEQRQQQRAFTRNLMQRARAGHIDWERVDERRGDEWYW